MILHEIVEEFKELLLLAEVENLPDEVIKDTLESVNYDFEEKAENTGIVIKELEAEEDKLEAEIKRLTDRKKTVTGNKNRLRSGLEEAMRAVGKTKFKTKLFSFNIQKNGGKLPVIVDVDVEKLPCTLVKTVRQPDLTAIERYLKENPDSDVGHFGERGERLRIT